MNPLIKSPLLALAAGLAVLLSSGCSQSGFADYQSQQKADTEVRAADPQWSPVCAEVDVLKPDTSKSKGRLQSFCVDSKGQILVCWDATATDRADGSAESGTSGVQVFSPAGKFLTMWPLSFGPEAITLAPSGKVFVGGNGQLARLSADGTVEASGASPALATPMMSDDEIRELIKDWDTGGANKFESYKKRLEGRRNDITGLAATDRDVFVACAAPKGFSYAAYRVDPEFKDQKLVVKKLSGCCSQMDLAARGANLWVAHNGRHRVECYDRDGKQLSSFGHADRRAADGFGGCCEPKNIRFAPDGTVLCAESGPPVCIKQFTKEGEFIKVVANPTYDSGCVRATVDVSPDGQKFYLLDSGDQCIHVFAMK